MVKNYVEQQIIPQLGIESVQQISLRTARRWLHKLGFHYKRYSKGVYIDGHERPDVVAYPKSSFRKLVNMNSLCPNGTMKIVKLELTRC